MSSRPNLNEIPLQKRAKVARKLIRPRTIGAITACPLDVNERWDLLQAIVWPSGPPPPLEPASRPTEVATGQLLIDLEGAA